MGRIPKPYHTIRVDDEVFRELQARRGQLCFDPESQTYLPDGSVSINDALRHVLKLRSATKWPGRRKNRKVVSRPRRIDQDARSGAA